MATMAATWSCSSRALYRTGLEVCRELLLSQLLGLLLGEVLGDPPLREHWAHLVKEGDRHVRKVRAPATASNTNTLSRNQQQ